jgi:hypothetical protein
MSRATVLPRKGIHHGRQSETRDPASREPAIKRRQADFSLRDGKREQGENDTEDSAECEALCYCAVGEGEAVEFDGGIGEEYEDGVE